MKHYILLSVEVPEFSNDEAGRNWTKLQMYLEGLDKTAKGIEQIGKGVWLIPRDSGIIFASECIARARALHLKAQARFLSADD